MKSRLGPVLFLLTWIASAAPQARTLHVPADYAEIQTAIGAAVNGDTVLVQPGRYMEELNFLGKAIVVTGSAVFDSSVVRSTVVDAHGGHSVVVFNSGEDANSQLVGLTLTGGHGTMNGMLPKKLVGGGILCDWSSPQIRNCLIQNNRAVGNDNNGLGGGVYFNESSALLDGCTIVNNAAGNIGGGIAAHGGAPTILRCRISRNEGNGVYLEWSYPIFRETTIQFNTLDSGAGGGGVSIHMCSPVFERCVIAGNYTLGWGGGLYFTDGAYTDPVLDSCTIVGNSARLGGGGMASTYQQMVVVNSILWGNVPDQIADTPPLVTYSDVQGGWIGEGNIDADPRFCDNTCATLSDLTLASDSPCLGTGEGGDTMGALPEACAQPAESRGPGVLEIPEDYPTIQEALDHACDGDTLLLAPAIYRESSLYFPPVDLVLRSWDPLDPEVVEATQINSEGREGLILAPGTEQMVWGISITNAKTALHNGNSSAIVSRCVFKNSVHAIYSVYGKLTVTDCIVSGNSNDLGTSGIYGLETDAWISHCVITHNYSNRSSAGIDLTGNTARIEDCVISNNRGKYGGGVSASCDVTISRCLIENNTADVYAGVRLSHHGAFAKISHCVIRGNVAADEGGGIMCSDITLEVVNTTIANNSARTGGGIYVFGSRGRRAGIVHLDFCTLANNTASRHGSGVFCEHFSDVTLSNTICWNPGSSSEIAGEPTAVTYCDIRGGWTGLGNIDSLPQFSTYSGFSQVLRPDSPCIDAGDPALKDQVSDWHPHWPQHHVDGPRCDMGSYGGPENGGWGAYSPGLRN